MNRLVLIAAAGALLVFGAAAQDPEATAKVKAEALATAIQMQMKMVGAVKGMTVKGAPYSGEEVNQTDQMLADGTRIHRHPEADENGGRRQRHDRQGRSLLRRRGQPNGPDAGRRHAHPPRKQNYCLSRSEEHTSELQSLRH